MTRTKLGLLSLCAALLGLMTFGASGAQAEEGAQWLLAKADGTAVGFLEAAIGFETDIPLVLHLKVSGIEVLFLCSTTAILNSIMKVAGRIGTGAKPKFSGCTTHLNGKTSAACEPNNGGTEPGVILTKPVHGLLILHKLASGTVDDLIKILPDEGETLATIEMSKECAIGTKIPLIGSLTLKDSEGLGRTSLVKHLVEPGGWGAELTEIWGISKTEEHRAFLLVAIWVVLTGSHAGMKFSGDPA